MYQPLISPEFIYIDLFCGAGGTTTGIVQAMNDKQNGIAKVIACVNHDHKAILSHWANHPEVKHFEEDIRTLNLSELARLVADTRALYPHAKVILWASLECTNFSKAKGGLARDGDSRTLAYTLYKNWQNAIVNEDGSLGGYVDGESYIQLIDPDYIQIENVTEFKDWGPSRIKMKNGAPVMIKNKHNQLVPGYEPIPELKGEEFKKWNKEICDLGYISEWKEMNSANYGAHTSRNRLFGIFAKPGLPIVWPEATHHKTGKNDKKKWNAVKEKLDFNDEGYSIFYRGKNADIPKRQRKDLSDNTLERVYAGCIKQIAGGMKNFMIKYHGGTPRINSIEKPLNVIDTQNRHAFVSVYHGNGDNSHSINTAGPAIPAADINSLVFIHSDYGTATNSSINTAAPTITKIPKLNVVQADAFIDNSHYKNPSTSVDTSLNTITANRKYPYLINLQWGGQMQDVSRPSPTLLATSDKTPLYLTITEHGETAIQIFDTDSDIIVKLKEFMAIYGIIDIKMRMLRVDELMKIQGFPDDYKLLGSQADQKKFIGNSVVPHVVKAWVEAMYYKTRNYKITDNNKWAAVAA